jgi:type IV pilus assembly protein PilC
MKRFSYTARDLSGKKVTGKVDAKTIEDAAKLLRERSLIIVHLAPDNGFFLFTVFKSANNRTGLADTSMFTRQFSTMVSAGLPITDALTIIRSQSKPSMQPVIAALLSDIEGGTSLAAAFEKHPKVFTPVYTSLVRAGETGGVLDKIFLRLAENMENQREFQAKVKGALIYPTIVVTGMLVVGFIMIIFVIPKLTAIYKDFGVELPTATKILIAISDNAQKFWWAFPLLVGSAFYGYRLYSNTPAGREKIDSLKFKLPITGKLSQQVILTEFARTLGLLISAGIPLLDGLRVVSGAMGNVVVSKGIDEAAQKIEKGFSLAYALSQNPKIFPPILYQMVAVGEETGKVDETLASVAHVFQQESEYSVRNLTAAIEPAIMIVMGIGVALLVIAVILPIYNLTNAF